MNEHIARILVLNMWYQHCLVNTSTMSVNYQISYLPNLTTKHCILRPLCFLGEINNKWNVLSIISLVLAKLSSCLCSDFFLIKMNQKVISTNQSKMICSIGGHWDKGTFLFKTMSSWKSRLVSFSLPNSVTCWRKSGAFMPNEHKIYELLWPYFLPYWFSLYSSLKAVQ